MQAFATQYTALILMILTFVIGAFASERMSGSREQGTPSTSLPPPPTTAMISAPQNPELTTVVFDRLFTEDYHVNAEALAAVRSILQQHDVDAEFVLPLTIGGSLGLPTDDDAAVRHALMRAGALRDSLVREGIPDGAVTVWLEEGGSLEGATGTLRRSDDER